MKHTKIPTICNTQIVTSPAREVVLPKCRGITLFFNANFLLICYITSVKLLQGGVYYDG
jgi:hypothetical protein